MLTQVIHTETMTVARLQLAKDCFVPEHKHVNEQVSMVEIGSLRFVLDGEIVVVKAGEVLRIPPNATHSAEAIEDSLVSQGCGHACKNHYHARYPTFQTPSTLGSGFLPPSPVLPVRDGGAVYTPGAKTYRCPR